MELVYSMRRKPLKCEPPHFETASDPEVIRPICTVSSSNIVAFSSPTALTDVEGDTWGGHVYVCDLDTPWNSYKVTTTEHPVSALEWDQEGNKLLVATTAGAALVYGQKDYQLNEWTLQYSCNFPGEHILVCTFFHNGRRVVATDKKADAPLTDKYQQLRSTPTLKGFGGAACAGVCVLTASGVIGCVVTPPHPAPHPHPAPAPGAAPAPGPATPPAPPATHHATNEHVCAATIKHSNGNIMIACVCKSSNSRARVRAYVCRVTHTDIHVQPLAAIHLHTTQTPTSIAWCHTRADVDSVLVAGSTLTLWKLTERSHALHKLFTKGPAQGNTTPGSVQKPNADVFNTSVWVQTGAWPLGEGAGRVAPCLAPHAVIVSPSALHLIAYQNHHYISSVTVATSGGVEPAPAASPPKKPKYNPGQANSRAVVCDASVCVSGGAVVAIDTHTQLHVYTLPLAIELPGQVSVNEVSSMLEYCMVAGNDCLDILFSLNSATAESVYERFTESFQRQSPGFQQYYYQSWLKIRIALCRRSAARAQCASWLTSLQMCHVLHAAAALPPTDKPADDDKFMLGLESKGEGWDVAGLVGLRRPLLRVLHLAATVLAGVGTPPGHGYWLGSHAEGLGLVRRLVGAAVASGRGGELLLRPLARLQPASAPHKQDFIEECQSISSMVCMTRVWECLPRVGVSTPTSRPKPLYLEYGVEPEVLKYAPEPPSIGQFDITPTLDMDTIRYMYLGGGGRVCRQRVCGRCGARGACGSRGAGGARGARALAGTSPAPAHAAARAVGTDVHPLQRAYDARFLSKCRCGGRWSVISNV